MSCVSEKILIYHSIITNFYTSFSEIFNEKFKNYIFGSLFQCMCFRRSSSKACSNILCNGDCSGKVTYKKTSGNSRIKAGRQG